MSIILVADDNAQQVMLRQELLQAAGHEVHTAMSTREVYQYLEHACPDVLMMDLKFPELEHGLALIRYLHEERPALPVIVLSGWTEELEGRAEEKLVARVVSKPARVSILLDAIRAVLPVLLCFFVMAATALAGPLRFTVKRASEVVADLELSSPGSDWSKPGREAALASVTLDGKSAQHVMLYAGERRHIYPAFLGALAPGEHTLDVVRHPEYSAAGSQMQVHGATFREVAAGDAEWPVLANAPILCARADTIGKFTDVPMIAYCEPSMKDGKTLLEYTVIFSNEDGGTSTRALMARWGRTTDIEFIYRGAVNSAGRVEHAIIQAKDHAEIPFDGVYEGTHPVLIPSTRNNMVSGKGRSPIRYQIAPVLVSIGERSREVVMDERPLSYRVMAQELEREGKLRPYGTVRGDAISDPRHYLYLEIGIRNQNSSVNWKARLKKESIWRSSNLGRADYGLERESGWYRSAIELPPGTRPQDIGDIAFECMVAPKAPQATAGTCRINGVASAFLLNDEYRPGVNLFLLSEAFDLPTGQMRVFPMVSPHVALTVPSIFAPARSLLSASR
jgi:CheY-like chemotaxis protein